METIILNIEDNAYDEIKSDLIGKYVTDSLYGPSLEFVKVIFEGIEKNKKELTIGFNKNKWR